MDKIESTKMHGTSHYNGLFPFFVPYLILFFTSASASDPKALNRECGLHSFNEGNYKEPTRITLNMVPEAIRRKVSAHLKDRLTEPFYKNLKYSRGQFISNKEKQLINTYNETKYPGYSYREIPTYELCFSFSNPDIGINSFSAAIQLREDGGVINEIELPYFEKSPEKLSFITLAQAEKIAREEMTSKVTGVATIDRTELDYRATSDSIVWVFDHFISYKPDYFGKYWRVEVSAHNGKIVLSSKGDEIY